MLSKLPAIAKRVHYWMTPLLEHFPAPCFPVRKRQIQVYVVGMPRSGTVSLYDAFKSNFRAAHEPESRFLTHKVVAYRRGRLSEQQMRSYLRHRDRRMGLELDTSYLNGEIVESLAEEFPDARFILTIRDVLSWTDSMMNFLLNKPEFLTFHKSHIQAHMEILFGAPPYTYAPEEAILQEKRLHPLSCYLKYWVEHNQRVIDSVPPERLLVIRTVDIGHSHTAIEKFLGLPNKSLKAAVHSNSASKRHSLLDQMPQEYVRTQVETYCGELMCEFFPEMMERL